jgi:uncharacterized protein with PIN domain
MKFLVDAQLPVRLARFLQASGYDTLHTRDLPQQNATSDTQINEISYLCASRYHCSTNNYFLKFSSSGQIQKLLL